MAGLKGRIKNFGFCSKNNGKPFKIRRGSLNVEWPYDLIPKPRIFWKCKVGTIDSFAGKTATNWASGALLPFPGQAHWIQLFFPYSFLHPFGVLLPVGQSCLSIKKQREVEPFVSTWSGVWCLTLISLSFSDLLWWFSENNVAENLIILKLFGGWSPPTPYPPSCSPNQQRKCMRLRHFLYYMWYCTDSSAGQDCDGNPTNKCWSCLSDLKNKQVSFFRFHI